MPNESIIIASDHGGYTLKEFLKQELIDLGYDPLDFGTNCQDSVDYPDFGHAVAEALIGGLCDRGVIICGTGIGISIAANRHPGIRAALCLNTEMAMLSRQHNNANLLALGGRIIDTLTAKECLNVFLTTDYEGGRHDLRISKLD